MIDIERLAREAGATTVDDTDSQCWAGDLAFDASELHRFAALVRNEVLEEAAKAAKEHWSMGGSHFSVDAIRALKDKT